MDLNQVRKELTGKKEEPKFTVEYNSIFAFVRDFKKEDLNDPNVDPCATKNGARKIAKGFMKATIEALKEQIKKI